MTSGTINLTTDKLGTGRFAIPTGDTSSWNIGTHRATVTYKMATAGPDYVQRIEFELLTAEDWPDDGQFTTYVSTRDCYRDGYAVATVTARAALHRILHEVAERIEGWTGRWFDPRYVKLKVGGQEASKLLLQSPIIAIEDIYAVWQTTTGNDTYKFEQYLYKVYNRHLDGFWEDDDRCHPYIELTNVDGTVVSVDGWAWPYGNQNIEVRGIFGYTNPETDPNNGRVKIGNTPRDIARVAGVIAARTIEDPTMSSPTTWQVGSIKSMKTRHQSITFGGAAGASSSSGNLSEPTGDPYLDSILVKYCQPQGFGAV